MEIYGICSDCLKDRIQLMPLTMAKAGEKLVLKDFSGGASARMRLLSMGLRIGDQIEVISNNSQGQIAVALEFKRYVLGHGLAQKIMVEPLKAQN
jgi:Fur family ferric uptake transcriptional regulator